MLQSIVGEDRKLIEVDAQCVRSGSFWSCGTRTVEHSIQNAYLDLIKNSQHFIYIEVTWSSSSSSSLSVDVRLESILRDDRQRHDDQESSGRCSLQSNCSSASQSREIPCLHRSSSVTGLFQCQRCSSCSLFHHEIDQQRRNLSLPTIETSW